MPAGELPPFSNISSTKIFSSTAEWASPRDETDTGQMSMVLDSSFPDQFSTFS